MSNGQKIPCSVSLLTFNSVDGLERCLNSLKEFEEIIICDGNSTDDTRVIAERFGAKIISQYDTDESNTRCAMDKAAVRQRAMGTSTLPWRFFMDSDDELSPEVSAEIRAITALSNPTHYVWRMPTRIFIDGREIRYEATYPSYQTRLVNKSVGAYFKNPVHDRLAWDTSVYPVGTMQSYYNFHWPQERVANYWGYLGAYARREVQTFELSGFFALLYWAYLRLRTIAGYLLWRLPAMYLRHGFAESMPLSIELTIVRYHVALLFGVIGKYVRTRVWVEILVGTLQGKDINRILFNLAATPYEAYGRVLDIGGGVNPSYWRYLQTRRWYRRISADLPHTKPDIVTNLEEASLPLTDGYCDTVLLFNVLEHINNRELLLREIRRVLKRERVFIGVVPFLVAVHPDPHDYVRFTDEGLRDLLTKAGFTDIVVKPVGRGPLTASYYQSEFLWPRLLKLLFLPLVLNLDALILTLRPAWRDKFPLSYVFCAR
ncbi:glycosyltransferase [Candidatus Nomurabacteria bacterium]|nr:glycosyltransferase [Candidatus Nomurabacteria bacterium]